MKPFDYFKKTFVFVFVFIIVYKAVGSMFNRFADLDLLYALKTLLVAFTTALVLGVINYFAKVDLFIKDRNQKSKE
ncbi:hypothetical protein [Flavobacterium sp. N1994]|uniref:hypothetical protein n=1 Tax=Flavobacterium sp. N1994 TaxID=2986827 RepID=UPI00222145BB|nr:hypothetical protein [Flavobacterium sp. N1994]